MIYVSANNKANETCVMYGDKVDDTWLSQNLGPMIHDPCLSKYIRIELAKRQLRRYLMW